ncbi:MutS protein msh4 [Saitozyma podzolica]|uniref:MutS protein msh4 n=1 Tax=Saitozyma podzolica TaxID=1890683 RepID=A0A427Y808_9TREE|nr:MutS protein msh4 [Saitozyma podzolica]
MSGVQEADRDRFDRESQQSLIQQAIGKQHSMIGSGHPSTRAGTIKMSTRASTIAEGLRDYVVALIQGKGAGVEVGIAAISLTTGKIADDNNFHRTIHHLTNYAPERILVPETLLMSAIHDLKERKGRTGGDLVQVLEDEFGVHCEPVIRALWKREAGLEFIQTLGAEDPLKASTVMQAADKYYSLCATAALLKWVQTKRGIIFTPNSLRISYTTLEGVMFIDPETARNLELVANSATHKSTNTLFGLLNTCFTPMGSRLLRANILQPCIQRTFIENRLDAVQELMQAGEGLNVVRDALEPLQKNYGPSEFGFMWQALIPQLCQQTAAFAKFQLTEHRITLLLQLKTLIKTLPALASSLRQCKASLLHRLQESLGNPDVLDITRLIENTEGLDCFTEWTEKGYRLVAAREGTDWNLPPLAINVERTKSKVKFTTQELQRKNSRLLQAQEEVFSLSQDTVAALLSQVLKHISPNMSGKSTYLRQIGLLTVQATLGCFVPAESAHLKLHDALVSRLSNDGTRHPGSDDRQPGGDPGSTEFRSVFHYKVVEGRSKLEHYGLELAKLAALPDAVTLKAKLVTDRRNALQAQGAVRGKLKQLGTASRLHEHDLSNYLRRLQDETVENLRITLEAEAFDGAEKLTGGD